MRKFAFIDMHIHTVYSDEIGCDTKIIDLLDRLNAMAEKEGGDVCFSITDHESILGCIEAAKLIKENKQKYKHLVFIPGIECNASLKEIEINNSHSTYSKCHYLGYGYNLKDENLYVFSKLAHMCFELPDKRNPNSKCNTGRQILSAIKDIETSFKTEFEFKDFKECINATNHIEAMEKFIEICCNKLKAPRQKIVNCFSSVVSLKPLNIDEASGGSKVKIVKLTKMIKNAGGKTSIAHPYSVRYNQASMGNDSNRYNRMKDFIHCLQMKTGNGLDAIELFHNQTTSNTSFLVFEQLARENNLFVSCGSDFHGSLHPHNELSKITSRRFEFNSLRDENVLKYKGQIVNKITSNIFVDGILDKNCETIKNRQKYVMTNAEFGNLDIVDIKEIISSIEGIKSNKFKEFYNISEKENLDMICDKKVSKHKHKSKKIKDKKSIHSKFKGKRNKEYRNRNDNKYEYDWDKGNSKYHYTNYEYFNTDDSNQDNSKEDEQTYSDDSSKNDCIR